MHGAARGTQGVTGREQADVVGVDSLAANLLATHPALEAAIDRRRHLHGHTAVWKCTASQVLGAEEAHTSTRLNAEVLL
jgi:hypothetical protein